MADDLITRLEAMLAALREEKPSGFGHTRPLWPEEKEEVWNEDLIREAIATIRVSTEIERLLFEGLDRIEDLTFDDNMKACLIARNVLEKYKRIRS